MHSHVRWSREEPARHSQHVSADESIFLLLGPLVLTGWPCFRPHYPGRMRNGMLETTGAGCLAAYSRPDLSWLSWSGVHMEDHDVHLVSFSDSPMTLPSFIFWYIALDPFVYIRVRAAQLCSLSLLNMECNVNKLQIFS